MSFRGFSGAVVGSGSPAPGGRTESWSRRHHASGTTNVFPAMGMSTYYSAGKGASSSVKSSASSSPASIHVNRRLNHSAGSLSYGSATSSTCISTKLSTQSPASTVSSSSFSSDSGEVSADTTDTDMRHVAPKFRTVVTISNDSDRDTLFPPGDLVTSETPINKEGAIQQATASHNEKAIISPSGRHQSDKSGVDQRHKTPAERGDKHTQPQSPYAQTETPSGRGYQQTTGPPVSRVTSSVRRERPSEVFDHTTPGDSDASRGLKQKGKPRTSHSQDLPYEGQTLHSADILTGSSKQAYIQPGDKHEKTPAMNEDSNNQGPTEEEEALYENFSPGMITNGLVHDCDIDSMTPTAPVQNGTDSAQQYGMPYGSISINHAQINGSTGIPSDVSDSLDSDASSLNMEASSHGFGNHKFHMDQRTEEAPYTDIGGAKQGRPDEEEHPFLRCQRDILRPKEKRDTKIVSSRGTIRGLKNLVKAGIATFAEKHEGVKNYRQLEKGKVVLYTTSVMIVRETYEKCMKVKKILQTHMIQFEERDIFMAKENQRALNERLGTDKLDVPQMFADGQHIGSLEEIEKMNESGELRTIFKNFQRVLSTSSCSKCGGYQYVPCSACHGSKKSSNRNYFTEEFSALRCTSCDENGLVRCDMCDSNDVISS